MREIARQRYETASVPGLTLFFHPTDDLPFFNYAIPDGPLVLDLQAALSLLRAEFGRRGRRPRFEFVAEYVPALAPALLAAGFAEEARQQLMICTSDSWRSAPTAPGLEIAELSQASTVEEMQTFLTLQRQGFDPESRNPSAEEEARRFLGTLGAGRAFVARLEGGPAGAGMYSSPLDGITEVVGLATLEPYRRRGIATALTAQAVSSALKGGVEVVCLTAADARAGRVYERVGFVPYATMLAYVDAGG